MLGVLTTNGQYTEYDPAATDGSEIAQAILPLELRAQDFNAVDAERVAPVLIAGPVKAGQLLLLDQAARSQMGNNFIFDDALAFGGNVNPWPLVINETALTRTVAVAENNSIFTNLGAVGTVTFTLPTIDRGLRYRFYNSTLAEDLVVVSALANTMIAFNDIAASSVALSTISQRAGSGFEIIANHDESLWMVFGLLGDGAVTVTVG